MICAGAPSVNTHRLIRVVEILEAADGGTRTHLLHILNGLDHRRFGLSCILSAERYPGIRDDAERLRARGIDVYEIPMVREVSPLRDSKAFFQIRRLLRQLRPDIVHTHASKAGALGRPAAWSAGVRHILHTPHVFYFEGRKGAGRRFYRMVERFLMRFTDKLILLAQGQKDLAQRELRTERLTVIANGVDLERFKPCEDKPAAKRALGLPEECFVIGAITRFRPQKGNDAILHALAKVMRNEPAARAVIAGIGPQRVEAIRLARELGVYDHCLWIERTDRPEELYSAMDAFLLASRYEGMPYTLLEAMASGVPVVATCISGCREVIEDGISGLLCEPDQPAALAENLLRLMRGEELRERLGSAARKRAEAFDIKRFIDKMTALYETEFTSR